MQMADVLEDLLADELTQVSRQREKAFAKAGGVATKETKSWTREFLI